MYKVYILVNSVVITYGYAIINVSINLSDTVSLVLAVKILPQFIPRSNHYTEKFIVGIFSE